MHVLTAFNAEELWSIAPHKRAARLIFSLKAEPLYHTHARLRRRGNSTDLHFLRSGSCD